MLGKIRKFSSSVFAKIFLFIVAIPFVFWGMGPLFKSGSQNIIVKIDKEKIPIEEFVNYINIYTATNDNLDSVFIEKMLSNFIGEKIIENEIKSFNIILSDESLSKLIRNEKIFKKDNKFSRTEYEKFLVKNSLSAITLETNISKQEKREQLLDFIGSGIVPPKFLVNIAYDKVKSDPKNLGWLTLQGQLMEQAGEWSQAIENYTKAIQLMLLENGKQSEKVFDANLIVSLSNIARKKNDLLKNETTLLTGLKIFAQQLRYSREKVLETYEAWQKVARKENDNNFSM